MNNLRLFLFISCMAISASNLQASEDNQQPAQSKNQQKREKKAAYKKMSPDEQQDVRKEHEAKKIAQQQARGEAQSQNHVTPDENNQEEIDKQNKTKPSTPTERLLQSNPESVTRISLKPRPRDDDASKNDADDESEFEDAQDLAYIPTTPKLSSEETIRRQIEHDLANTPLTPEDVAQNQKQVEEATQSLVDKINKFGQLPLGSNNESPRNYDSDTEDQYKDTDENNGTRENSRFQSKYPKPEIIPVDANETSKELAIIYEDLSIDKLSEEINVLDDEIQTLVKTMYESVDNNENIQKLLKLKKDRSRACQAYNEKYALENKDEHCESYYTPEEIQEYKTQMMANVKYAISSALTLDNYKQLIWEKTKEEIQLRQDEFKLSTTYFDEYTHNCEKLLQEKIAQRKHWFYAELTIQEKAELLALVQEKQRRAEQLKIEAETKKAQKAQDESANTLQEKQVESLATAEISVENNLLQ